MRDELRAHVHSLAEVFGERNVEHPDPYRRAAEYIAAQLGSFGYAVDRQSYTGSSPAGPVGLQNIVVHRPGAETASEIVVVGAHYDSVAGSPGADDNASGVAALLVIAHRFAGKTPSREVRFVAFANEEPAAFKTEEMGSLVYARACRERGDRIAAMLSLETMGYFSDDEGSQQYPFPFGLLYPSKGNFIAFISDRDSAPLVRRAVASFRKVARIPSEGGAVPRFVPGVGWSDHWAFWQNGYPAIMITDTAPFRNPHYHTAQDTPGTLDYDRFAHAIVGVAQVVEDLTRSP